MRQYIRHPSDIPIRYSLGEVVCDKQDYLKNISQGGLCFCAQFPLEEGASIRIEIPISEPVFSADGIVVWCHSVNHHYEVGVQFKDLNTESAIRMVEQVCHIQHYKKEIWETEGRELTSESAAIEWIKKYASDFPE